MAVETGNDGANIVFVVGSPRSGTTWFQRLLACHPRVRTGQESGVFDSFIGPMLRAWERDMDSDTHGRGALGLGCYLTEEEFIAQVRQLLDGMLAPMTSTLEPGMVFLEKTPSHALFLPEIAKLLPRARVVHVLRDCRDVCASLLAASRSWGKAWAPRTGTAAASMWVSHVRAARAGAALFPGRFAEVRYEDMKRDVTAAVHPVVTGLLELEWEEGTLGVPGSSAEIPVGGEYAKRCDMQTVEDPKGFVRKAKSGSWREDLSVMERIAIWRTARGVMREMGYPWSAPW